MKIVLVGLVLLWTLSLAWAQTGNPSIDPKSKQVAHQDEHVTNGQVSTPAHSHVGHGAAILSRTEADSLHLQGDGQLAASGVSEIKVGEINGSDLIYILVVVLLVVVILAVVR
jgi:hypothetical protein